jgi:hypothetical protein
MSHGLTTGYLMGEVDPRRPRTTEHAAIAAHPLVEDARVYWRGTRILVELWFTRATSAEERAEAARAAVAAIRAWVGQTDDSWSFRARAGRAALHPARRKLPWLEP